ncbi:MAG: acyl carrier protein [Eubacteriales bacterium]|nr:acyl carrier protein [Eubacteriales bacterium]
MLNIIVKNLIDYVEIDLDRITEKTSPVSDLNLNSYDFISLIGKLEAELGIDIPERDFRNFQTLGDLDQYIKEKIQH